MTMIHHPGGSLADGSDPLHLTAERAGWTYAGLRVLKLEPGESRTIPTSAYEMVILPLSGGGLSVECEGELLSLQGRETVFSRVTDFAYAPIRSDIRIASGDGAEVALCMAKAEKKLAPAYGPADDVVVETIGAGPATRQVTKFFTPDSWDDADKLICYEVLTPDGNWSSYPPHKHDESTKSESKNEQLSYYRIGEAGSTNYASDGFGFHRSLGDAGDSNKNKNNSKKDGKKDRGGDETIAVGDGDVCVLPSGFHGPAAAAPGYSMYSLNVLAGPGAERAIESTDHPDHQWVRTSWASMPQDPRSPMTSSEGSRP